MMEETKDCYVNASVECIICVFSAFSIVSVVQKNKGKAGLTLIDQPVLYFYYSAVRCFPSQVLELTRSKDQA